MTKRVTLLFVAILTLSSLTVVNVALAAVSKPPVPKFTVDYEDRLDYVPPVYSVNKYTGETTLVQQGYHVENKTITLTIKNQPFTQGTTEDKPVSLSYNIRVKGHFEEDWTYLGEITSSDSDYTITSYAYGNKATNDILRNVPTDGGELDFQVQAEAGYYTQVWVEGVSQGCGGTTTGHYEQRFTQSEPSGWSNTQTLTIKETQTPPLSPEQTDVIVGVAIVSVVLGIMFGVLVYLIKRK
jgi:hypothetical protein